ncbi:MAG: hypothetical protein QOD36_1150 [Mycobacterium sp.]|jgi:hypothetical protein|nr:hypothetical protein [Mycobacterium sp.]MDT5331059.1 hypothetical protein [Mycobacterium sp.]
MAAETVGPTPEDGAPPEGGVRTAVVIVHGMGEKRPMETLDDFAKTALRPRADRETTWDYYPLPAEITDTYEARRFASAQAEIYEYDWSFLMTASKYAGAMPMALLLLLRRPSNVPDALLGIWRRVWTVVVAILLVIPALFVTGYALNTDVPAWMIGLIISAVVLVFWFGLYRMAAKALVNSTTTSLVDVARYLDPSPYSYAARRAIRGGLVDLLHALHDGRYSRIAVVAHGVGTYIAYDALTVFWAEPRPQETHWRITDFVTIGAPMALADFLVTRPGLFSGFKKSDGALRRELFDGLVRRGALVLGSHSPFTVTRWTNLWFPVVRGSLHGDWFGGALGPLFGEGIRDIPVEGNQPERLKRGSAHNEYFRHPDKDDEGDVAGHLRKTLAL